ncbi:MAG: hypothetical protein MJ107_03745 [Lachnospiraceae bacterium]|nr:hypothetical protein [Lachnospiraceae bacterium]
MKKVLALALSLVLVLSLTACGKTETAVSESTEASVEASVETSVEEASVEETSVEEVVEPEVTDEAAVMTYADYVAADLDSEVVVECYVQAHQSWWDNQITVYAADEDGAYFMYNMACSEEDAEKLVPGTKIKVTGFKSEWSGEVEIVDATFEILEGSYVAEAFDATSLIGSDDLVNYQNQLVSFSDMTVTAVSYKNNEPGDDIYVNLEKDGTEMYFCLEYYLNGSDAEFYDLVGNLEVGAVVDVEGFLYWYEGANPHLTKVTVK